VQPERTAQTARKIAAREAEKHIGAAGVDVNPRQALADAIDETFTKQPAPRPQRLIEEGS
jgi:hypothetical protein